MDSKWNKDTVVVVHLLTAVSLLLRLSNLLLKNKHIPQASSRSLDTEQLVLELADTDSPAADPVGTDLSSHLVHMVVQLQVQVPVLADTVQQWLQLVVMVAHLTQAMVRDKTTHQ